MMMIRKMRMRRMMTTYLMSGCPWRSRMMMMRKRRRRMRRKRRKRKGGITMMIRKSG